DRDQLALIVMNLDETAFDGLFLADVRHGPFTATGRACWDFDTADLNDAARAVFQHLDRRFGGLQRADSVFLATIELDAEAGRFPDGRAQYFHDSVWAYMESYYVGPISRIGPGDIGGIGRLTFEGTAGQISRALGQSGGFRWGANLRVWGFQVAGA